MIQFWAVGHYSPTTPAPQQVANCAVHPQFIKAAAAIMEPAAGQCPSTMQQPQHSCAALKPLKKKLQQTCISSYRYHAVYAHRGPHPHTQPAATRTVDSEPHIHKHTEQYTKNTVLSAVIKVYNISAHVHGGSVVQHQICSVQ